MPTLHAPVPRSTPSRPWAGRGGKRQATQGGVAIIMVLLTVAFVVGLAASTLSVIDAGITRRIGAHDQLQAQLLAQAAVDRARQVLVEDLRLGNVDHLAERWATGPLPVSLPDEDSQLAVSIIDPSGRINLNNLIHDGVDDTREIARLQRLMRSLGIDEATSWQLITALLDWLDADDTPRPGQGAEVAWYAAQTPPVQPANGPLAGIGELAAVRGYTPELLARLSPFLSALPTTTPLNVNTAPAEILAAAVPGLSLQAARQLVEERQRAWFKDIPDFNARLGSLNLSGNGMLLAVDSRYFLVSIRARHGIAVVRHEVLLDRTPNRSLILWQRRL